MNTSADIFASLSLSLCTIIHTYGCHRFQTLSLKYYTNFKTPPKTAKDSSSFLSFRTQCLTSWIYSNMYLNSKHQHTIPASWERCTKSITFLETLISVPSYCVSGLGVPLQENSKTFDSTTQHHPLNQASGPEYLTYHAPEIHKLGLLVFLSVLTAPFSKPQLQQVIKL